MAKVKRRRQRVSNWIYELQQSFYDAKHAEIEIFSLFLDYDFPKKKYL